MKSVDEKLADLQADPRAREHSSWLTQRTPRWPSAWGLWAPIWRRAGIPMTSVRSLGQEYSAP